MELKPGNAIPSAADPGGGGEQPKQTLAFYIGHPYYLWGACPAKAHDVVIVREVGIIARTMW